MLKTSHLLLLCAVVFYTTDAQSSLNLTEGKICKREGTRVSTCKYAYDCPKALQDFNVTGKRPVVCNFLDKHPVLCCEPDDVNMPPPGTKSKQKCKEYAASVYIRIPSEVGDDYIVNSCVANVEPLIVGGVDALPKEYPHMALIGYGRPNSKYWLCGGSLVSERFVLSAAHCTKSSEGLAKWVMLGEYNKKSSEDEEVGLSNPTEYEIVERINHPGYQEPSLYHDIALYRLDRDVKFNEYIRPICLQTEYAVHKSYGIATGWGRLEFGGRESGTLQKVNVTFKSPEKCRELYNGVYGSSRQLKNGILDANMFCAGDDEHDSCQGDSGGPLQLRLQEPYCMYSQIGVTSFGDGCAYKPGVYTRVSHYISWIERTVWP